MAKIPITVVSGNEIQGDGNCTFWVFLLQDDKREVLLGKAFTDVQNRDKGNIVGRPIFDSAVAGVRPEIGGRWVDSTFTLEEGTILRVKASRRKGHRTLVDAGQLYIQMRADAALHAVVMPTLQVAGRSRLSQVDVTGRFDILPVSTVIKDHGIKVPFSSEQQFLPSAVESIFMINVLEKERSPRDQIVEKTLKAADGGEVAIRTRRRFRMVEM